MSLLVSSSPGSMWLPPLLVGTRAVKTISQQEQEGPGLQLVPHAPHVGRASVLGPQLGCVCCPPVPWNHLLSQRTLGTLVGNPVRLRCDTDPWAAEQRVVSCFGLCEQHIWSPVLARVSLVCSGNPQFSFYQTTFYLLVRYFPSLSLGSSSLH